MNKKKEKKFLRSVGSAIVKFFTTDLLTKLIVLILSVLLWGFVLVYQNPVRNKTIGGVQIALEGSSDLQARNLIVVDTELGTASVVVSTEITKFTELNADRITCTASLATVTEAGTYPLYLDANVLSNLGSVSSITPETVTVTVDNLLTRSIPLRLNTTGELPEGYVITKRSYSSTVSVEGAARYLAPISYAVATVDQSALTSDYYSAVELSFYDTDGKLIDVQTRSGTAPSALISLDISATKRVPVELSSDTVLPDATYYDTSCVFSQDEVVLLADEASTLAAVDCVYLEPMVVTQDMNGQYLDGKLQLPDGVTLSSNYSSTTRATFTVEEKETDLTLTLPVSFESIPRGLAPVEVTVEIRVHGTVLALEDMAVEDWKAVVDLSELHSVGVYDCALTLSTNWAKEYRLVDPPTSVSVTLRNNVS